MKSRRLVVSIAALLAPGVYVACGIDEGTSLWADAGDGDAAIGSDTDPGIDPSDDSGNNSGEAGGPFDAGSDGALDGDSGVLPIQGFVPGGDAATVNCGSMSCALSSTRGCCVAPAMGDPPYYAQCSPTTSCLPPPPDAGVADGGRAVFLECETVENCPVGEICCIRGPRITSPGALRGLCAQASQCRYQRSTLTDGGIVTTTALAILCDPSAADSGCQLSDAGACSAANIRTWNLPLGFGTCGGIERTY